MKSSERKLYQLVLAGVAGCVALAMTGCSNGGSGGGVPVTAAKNLYVIQNNYNSDTDIESDAVLVLTASGSGAVTPSATLILPTNFYAYSLTVAPGGRIYVGGDTGGDSGQILVYAAGATGAATPTATITAAASGTFTYPDYMAVSSAGQLLVASEDGSVEAFAASATGAATPDQYLTYGLTNSAQPSGIGTDASGEVFLSDVASGSIYVFAAGATGATVPARTITGTDTSTFGYLLAMTVDSKGEVTVASYNPADDPFGDVRKGASPREHRPSKLRGDSFKRLGARPHVPALPTLATGLVKFAAGATGAATPATFISGSLTTVNEPVSLAVDGLSNLYYEDFEGGTPTLMTFSATAMGNVAPATSMTSTALTFDGEEAIAAF